MKELTEWGNFYLIVGAAAGALIGLQFVVLTLIAERPLLNAAEANAAFSTPTIVYFGTALLLSALLQAPWQSIAPVAIVWGVIGLSGVVYVIIVARRMRMQNVYKPVFHDWLFHFLLPFMTYVILSLSAFAAFSNKNMALFGVGISALLLLLIGIHNAWDAVTYHVFVSRTGQQETSETKTEKNPNR
jgi:RsiW-degrading membrane proteinase PrsW (M82 family)